jgi:hypothetical protein
MFIINLIEIIFIYLIGIACYDKTTLCSVYQNFTQYCDNRYSLIVNNISLSVPQACTRSCGLCVPAQRLNDILPPIGINDEDYTTESATSSSTTTTTTTYFQQNIILSREGQ